MPTIAYTESLVTEVCWCGINHAIPSNLARQARENGTSVYCPLGHQWVCTETEVDKLKKKLAAEERRAAQRLAQLDQERSEREAAERKLIASKGQITKLKKRAQGGACPCCNRTFVQLARHIATKHPNFEPESFT